MTRGAFFGLAGAVLLGVAMLGLQDLPLRGLGVPLWRQKRNMDAWVLWFRGQRYVVSSLCLVGLTGTHDARALTPAQVDALTFWIEEEEANAWRLHG